MRSSGVKWILITGCWLVWGLFNASRLRIVIPDATWSQALAYAMPDALIWALLTPVVIKLAAVFPVRPGNMLVRIPSHLALALLTALTHTLLDTVETVALGSSLGFWALYGKIARHTVHLNVLVYIVIVCLYQYVHHYWKTRDEQRKNAELRAQLSDARLASLEAQLRPHFLFNTLNTISGLMESDPKSGRQVVCRLSELLRSSLRGDGQREVPVERELENVRAYLEIEQVRFAGRLEAHVHAESTALRCAVPSFILQPIVENAVHHGLADGNGEIEVTASRHNGEIELQVRDSGAGPASGTSGHGVGLTNTSARLSEMYGEAARIRIAGAEEGGTVVTITLPARETH